MVVGEDITVVGHDEPGALAPHGHVLGEALKAIAEKLPEERVVREGRR